MSRRPVIAVTLSPSNRYHRSIYRGVADYARIPPRAFEARMAPLTSLRSIRPAPDGIIAHLNTPRLVAEARSLRIPVVNNSRRIEDTGLPSVTSDDVAAGRLAAEHLLGCGFRHFAFYGREGIPFSLARSRGFVRAVEAAGFQCDLYLREQHTPGRPKLNERRRVQRWLAGLPRPVGVLALTDWCALDLYDACARLGLRVRDEVGIVGVDNDEFVCESCDPSLSSVDNRPERIGYEAAALLMRLLRGGAPPTETVLIPPLGVVARQSTDVFVGGDPHVAAALHFIRDHADRALEVKDVLARVPLSRRILERRFRKDLGRSVLEEIHRHRVERIQQLLTTTDHTIGEIAEACGFENPSYIATLFRKKTGLTPRAYRRQYQNRRLRQ
jgi:LacI family transcriptional regulator